MKFRLPVQAFTLVLLLVLAPAARALSFEFSGTWGVGLPQLAGRSFSGSFAYDASSIGTPTPLGTNYFPHAMSVDVFGDGTHVVDLMAVVRVADDNAAIFFGSVNDFFQIGFINPAGLPQAATLSALIGKQVRGFRLDLVDPEEDAISSEALPSAAELLSFSDVFRTLSLTYAQPDGTEQFQLGRVAQLSQVSGVPAPDTIALMLVALAGLGLSRRIHPFGHRLAGLGFSRRMRKATRALPRP